MLTIHNYTRLAAICLPMQKITGQHVSEKNAYLKDLDTLIPFLLL